MHPIPKKGASSQNPNSRIYISAIKIQPRRGDIFLAPYGMKWKAGIVGKNIGYEDFLLFFLSHGFTPVPAKMPSLTP